MLKNDNFKTRDFSPLIERVLAGVTYQGRFVGLGSTGSQQQSLLSHCACEVPNLPQSILSLSETAHLSWGVVGPLGVVVFMVVVPEVVGSLQANSFQSLPLIIQALLL